jgi:hypothetical protein
VILGSAVLAGIGRLRQSQRVEQLFEELSRRRIAHEEEDRQRWQTYFNQVSQSRARIEEMAKTMAELRKRQEQIGLSVAKIAEQRTRDEARVATEDAGQLAATIQQNLSLGSAPAEQNGGLFFPLPLSRQLAMSALGCHAIEAELALRRQECQSLRDQLSLEERKQGELQSLARAADENLAAQRDARRIEAAEYQKMVKRAAKAGRRGFWEKVWDRTKIVLAFAAGATVGQLAR